jgi:hypothetical protein
VTDREDRAAEVAEDDDSGALVGAVDRIADAALVGPERTVGGAAGVLDAHVGAGHLPRELRQPPRKLRAV